MPELISRAEFARRKGWSKPYVTQLVQAGRIKLVKVGGKQLIDPIQTERDLKASEDPVTEKHGGRPGAGRPRKDGVPSAQPKIRKPTIEKPVSREPAVHPLPSMDPTGKKKITLIEARTMNEAFKAKLTKLEYEIRTGKYIESEQVKRDSFTTGRVIRDRLLSIPHRVAASLAGETNQFKVQEILREEIIQSLESLPGSMAHV